MALGSLLSAATLLRERMREASVGEAEVRAAARASGHASLSRLTGA